MARAKNPAKNQITAAERGARKRAKKAAKAAKRAKRAEAKAEAAKAKAEAKAENLAREREREAAAKARREAKAKAKAESAARARAARQATLIALRASEACEWVVLVRFAKGAHGVRVHNVGAKAPKGWREARVSRKIRGKRPGMRFGATVTRSGREIEPGAERLAERLRSKLAANKRAG